MKPFGFKEMSELLFNEFGITTSEKECKDVFSKTIPFSRFLDYLRSFILVNGGGTFLTNATIDEIFAPIWFDQELKNLLIKAVLRIEEGVKSAVFETANVHHMAFPSDPVFHSGIWYLDPRMYATSSFYGPIKSANKVMDHRKDWSIMPFSAPVSWDLATSPGFSFGSLVKMMRIFTPNLIEKTGWTFGAKYPNGDEIPGDVLLSICNRLKTIRNICGHGEVLWPKRLENIKVLPGTTMAYDNSKVYAVSLAIFALLEGTLPSKNKYEFKGGLLELLNRTSEQEWSNHMNFKKILGFDAGWESLSEWNMP